MSNIIDKFRAALINLEYDIAELDNAVGLNILECAYALISTYHRIRKELGLDKSSFENSYINHFQKSFNNKGNPTQ